MMLKLLTAAALLALIGTAAAAEPPIGSRLGDRLKPVKVQDEKASALRAHELARCMVAQNGRAVRLTLADADPDAIRKLNSNSSGWLDCSNTMKLTNDFIDGLRVAYPTDVMRGMLAEYLVKADRSSYRKLTPLPRQTAYARPWFPATTRPVAVDEMATCVAEVQPRAVLSLLDSRPYSEGERQVLASLAPVMGPCLRIGAKLSANRQALRAALAESLYQRAQSWVIPPAPQPQPQQGAAK